MDLALRKSYRGQLTKLVNSVDDFLKDDSVSMDDVAVLFERIKIVNLTLKDLNDKLAPTFQEEQFEEECKKIVDYDDSATKALALLQRKLTSEIQLRSELQRNLDEANSVVPPPPVNVNTVNNGNYNQNIVQHTSVRLPKLDIIKFNGEIALWPEFWEQYSVAIHENKTLDNTAKFAYLKSYLTGKAAITISGLSSSQSSYNDAIDLLKTEYACSEKIIDTYVQKLLSLSQVKHERDIVALRKLFTITTTITKSLATLGISPDQYGLLVKSIVFKALPYNMRIAYTKQKLNTNFDDKGSVSGASNASSSNSSDGDYEKQIKTLLHFIKVELDSIEQARCNDFNEHKDRDKKQFRFDRREKFSEGRRDEFTAAGLFASAKENCLFCKSKSHVTSKCDGSLNISAKKDILKQNKLCFRCTKPNHNSRFCRSRDITCAKCRRRHVTTMCEGNGYIGDNTNAQIKPKSVVDNFSKNSNDESTSLVAAAGISKNIYLKTACTFILSASVEPLLVRMIIDGGSQLSFIREDVSRSLGLLVVGTHKIAIQCFGQSDKAPARVCNRVKVRLNSQYSNNIVELCVIEVPEICFDNIKPPSNTNPVIKEFSLENCLADFVIGSQQPIPGISLLIGADNYWNIVSHETVRLSNNLSAINTQFGWTIHGASDNISDDNYLVNFNSSMVLHVQMQDDLSDNLDLNLKKFWDLETIGISASDTTLMNKFTENFIKNNITFENERYQVILPWKTDDKILDTNFSGTLVRAKGLVNKLCKNGTLKDYDTAVREYVRTGCAEEVPNNQISEKLAYYMPHRPVYRNDKETTKLRVVFDASAHARGTPSLNDKLLTGENLLSDLLTILINFRLGAVALIADIEKAFLQIGLSKEDRDYHRFLWFKNPIDDNITSTSQLPDFTTFRMTRVTFGVTTSPFLLAVVIKKHLTESSEKDIATTLLKSFYVDDLVLAVQSTSEALELYEKAKNILLQANMNLRKWYTNDPTVLPYVNRDEERIPIGNINSSVKKVLGIIWRPFSDELAVDLGATHSSEPNVLFTKRSVLQTIAKIFDPIGVLGPFTVKAKIILQNIWKKRLDWDDVLPEDIDKEWRKWYRGLPLLNEYSINRCLIKNPTDEIELHVFADASPQAYGCVAYLKHVATQKCKFIVSKNRVSPINENNEKTLTLPKLELTAALCAVRLQKYLTENTSLNVKEVILWSDSKIALYWIKGKETKWKPYVQNRVVEIRKLQGKDSWRYCPGKQNPADLITRGVLSANHLIDSEVWLTGPPWLEQEREHWPIDEFLDKKEMDVLTCFVEVQEKPTLILNPIFNLDRLSSLDKIFRITAYVKRFLNNVRKNKENINGPLRVSEVIEAEIYWLRVIQQETFGYEISYLINQKPLPTQSTILTLRPFLDENQVLRLGGRLQEAYLSPEEKHPVILPRKSALTSRIIWKAHNEVLHSGVNSTLAMTRKRFWIIKGRQQIKSVISGCVKCKRLRGKPGSQPFAPLPKDRVTLSHPFEVTGVDFAGPLYVSSANRDKTKVYIMLLTCAAIRAVHLELVPNLNTESCLRGMRRFIARRGVLKVIYSDNAKTFKRASEELYQLQGILSEPQVQDLARAHRIEWKFIVERAAWWGGFWERLVRTVKNGLKSALGRKLVNFDELQTVLSEIEVTVNSRPLTYIDEDPSNLKILSPAMFLIGNKTLGIRINTNTPKVKRDDIIKAWLIRESIVSKFWKVWSQDYLQQLRSAHYGKQTKGSSFKVGDVVLLHDQHRPRLTWKLVRISNCFQGRDGRIRACEFLTSDGTRMRRPVQLLYPLEIEDIRPGEDVENSI